MHFKLIVLISVTLTLVQLSHTFRVPGAQNGPEQQQHFRLSDNNFNVVDDDDYLVPANNNRMKSSRYNSLSDILNNDEDEEEEEEEQEPSSAEYEADFNKELEKIISQQDQHKAAASSRASKGSRLAADFEEYLKSAPSSSAPAAAAAATASKPASQSAADPVVVVEDEEELESHSSLVGGQGHQYVSGGAGEGKQHLQPDGAIDNKEEVKSDEDLPAYCDPPNPCPLGVVADDCDPRPFDMFSAQFSKEYQEQQNCMCDDDHNECHKRSKNSGGSVAPSERVSDLINNLNNKLTVVAKKSPRVRREVKSDQNATKRRLRNPYLRGEAINIHVAKKSTHF